ncbi:MAG: MFS transporter [Candidatus Dojkabacteria bacterium]|nr:MFS transporter [Candidatus Dojkabacteria bacterium]
MIDHISRFKRVIAHNKKFLYLWLAQIFTQSAVSIVTINMGILSHEGTISSSMKDSAASIGVMVNLSTLPGLLVAPLAGVLADWFPKKKIMITSNLVRLFILAIFLITKGWERILDSYILIFLLSVVLQFFIPAEGGLVPRLVKKKYILLANSLFSVTVYSSLAFGVTVSGIILSLLGIRNMFLLCVVFIIISTILLLSIKIVEPRKSKRSIGDLVGFVTHLVKDVGSGIRYSFSKSKLRFALLHLLLLQVVALTLVTIIFRIGSEIYGVSPRTAGLVVFAPLILGLLIGLGTLNIYGRNKSRVKLIWLGTVFSIFGFGLMAVIAIASNFLEKYLVSQIVATFSLVAVGICVPFLLIPGQTLLFENTERSFRGRVLGIWQALTSSLAAFVAVFVGYLTDRVGDVSIAIVFVVVADIIYSIILYLLQKRNKV